MHGGLSRADEGSVLRGENVDVLLQVPQVLVSLGQPLRILGPQGPDQDALQVRHAFLQFRSLCLGNAGDGFFNGT